MRVLLDECVPRRLHHPGLDLALVIVSAPSNDIKDLQPKMPEVLRVLETIRPGQVVHVGA